jgi:hypothetical protein
MRKPARIRKPAAKAMVDEKKIAAAIAELEQLKPKSAKAAKTIALFKSWLKDESGHDEEIWPKLKRALNEERERVGAPRLFDD